MKRLLLIVAVAVVVIAVGCFAAYRALSAAPSPSPSPVIEQKKPEPAERPQPPENVQPPVSPPAVKNAKPEDHDTHEVVTSKPAVAPIVEKKAPAAKPPSRRANYKTTFTGVTPLQQLVIDKCLRGSHLPETYEIVLERSGRLHITSGPSPSGLTECLRDAFSDKTAPAKAIIKRRLQP